MVLNYMLAQLLPGVRGRKGFLLVLSSGNVDEALRGYVTASPGRDYPQSSSPVAMHTLDCCGLSVHLMRM